MLALCRSHTPASATANDVRKEIVNGANTIVEPVSAAPAAPVDGARVCGHALTAGDAQINSALKTMNDAINSYYSMRNNTDKFLDYINSYEPQRRTVRPLAPLTYAVRHNGSFLCAGGLCALWASHCPLRRGESTPRDRERLSDAAAGRDCVADH